MKKRTISTGKLFVAGVIALLGIFFLNPTTISAETTDICVDGKNRNNLTVTWNADTSSATVTPKAALCADTTIYMSSYLMPDNYDGSGFGGPTSFPQTVVDTTTAVLTKGAPKAVTMTVKVPDPCKSKQVDVYYGPEIKVVDQKGHAGQYISGGPVKGTGECTPEPTPIPLTPVTPTTPAVLPSTGAGSTIALFAAIAAVAGGIHYVVRRKA